MSGGEEIKAQFAHVDDVLCSKTYLARLSRPLANFCEKSEKQERRRGDGTHPRTLPSSTDVHVSL